MAQRAARPVRQPGGLRLAAAADRRPDQFGIGGLGLARCRHRQRGRQFAIAALFYADEIWCRMVGRDRSIPIWRLRPRPGPQFPAGLSLLVGAAVVIKIIALYP